MKFLYYDDQVDSLLIFSKNKNSQARFKWTDDKLTNLIKCLQEFKSSMEFRNYESNAEKVKLYEGVRKSLNRSIYSKMSRQI